jgi:hypothetical protein
VVISVMADKQKPNKKQCVLVLVVVFEGDLVLVINLPYIYLELICLS